MQLPETFATENISEFVFPNLLDGKNLADNKLMVINPIDHFCRGTASLATFC